MTPEERFERIERQMEFIVNQRAQFSAGLEKAREELRAEIREKHALHEKQINALNAAVVALLATTHKLAEAQRKTEEGMQRLEATSTETQERLHILIDMFEGYLSDRRNGPSAPNEGAPSGET